jgi:hypothetical protein
MEGLGGIMKRLVEMRVAQWREILQDLVEKSAQAAKPLISHLPGFVTWLVLTLCMGWIGGRWAAQSVMAQRMALGSISTASSEEGSTTPRPQRAPASEPERRIEGKPYLGIRGKEVRQGEIRGVKVIEVFPGAPAATAGLHAAHDALPADKQHSPEQAGHIIIGANGRIVRSEDNLATILAQSAPGDVLTLLVISADGGSYEIIPVTLGVAPDPSAVILTSTEVRSSQTP